MDEIKKKEEKALIMYEWERRKKIEDEQKRAEKQLMEE